MDLDGGGSGDGGLARVVARVEPWGDVSNHEVAPGFALPAAHLLCQDLNPPLSGVIVGHNLQK